MPSRHHSSLTLTPIGAPSEGNIFRFDIYEGEKNQRTGTLFVQYASSGKAKRLWRLPEDSDVQLNSLKTLVLLMQIAHNPDANVRRTWRDENDTYGVIETEYFWSNSREFKKILHKYRSLYDQKGFFPLLKDSEYTFTLDSEGMVLTVQGQDVRQYSTQYQKVPVMGSEATLSIQRRDSTLQANPAPCQHHFATTIKTLNLVPVTYALIPQNIKSNPQNVTLSLKKVKIALGIMSRSRDWNEKFNLRDQIAFAAARDKQIERWILQQIRKNLSDAEKMNLFSGIILHMPEDSRERVFFDVLEELSGNQAASLVLLESAQFSDLNGSVAVPRLQDWYDKIEDPKLRIQIIYSSSTLSFRSQLDSLRLSTKEWLIKEFHKDDATRETKIAVIDGLANLHDFATLSFLFSVLAGSDATLHFKAMNGIATIAGQTLGDILLSKFRLQSFSPEVRDSWIEFLVIHPELLSTMFCKSWLIEEHKFGADTFKVMAIRNLCQNNLESATNDSQIAL